MGNKQAYNSPISGHSHFEKVQRRASKLVPQLKSLPYTERLQALNLYTIAQRRLRGALIETFKLVKGKKKSLA